MGGGEGGHKQHEVGTGQAQGTVPAEAHSDGLQFQVSAAWTERPRMGALAR